MAQLSARARGNYFVAAVPDRSFGTILLMSSWRRISAPVGDQKAQ
jgi:hypothetical protein